MTHAMSMEATPSRQRKNVRRRALGFMVSDVEDAKWHGKESTSLQSRLCAFTCLSCRHRPLPAFATTFQVMGPTIITTTLS